MDRVHVLKHGAPQQCCAFFPPRRVAGSGWLRRWNEGRAAKLWANARAWPCDKSRLTRPWPLLASVRVPALGCTSHFASAAPALSYIPVSATCSAYCIALPCPALPCSALRRLLPACALPLPAPLSLSLSFSRSFVLHLPPAHLTSLQPRRRLETGRIRL